MTAMAAIDFVFTCRILWNSVVSIVFSLVVTTFLMFFVFDEIL